MDDRHILNPGDYFKGIFNGAMYVGKVRSIGTKQIILDHISGEKSLPFIISFDKGSCWKNIRKIEFPEQLEKEDKVMSEQIKEGDNVIITGGAWKGEYGIIFSTRKNEFYDVIFHNVMRVIHKNHLQKEKEEVLKVGDKVEVIRGSCTGEIGVVVEDLGCDFYDIGILGSKDDKIAIIQMECLKKIKEEPMTKITLGKVLENINKLELNRDDKADTYKDVLSMWGPIGAQFSCVEPVNIKQIYKYLDYVRNGTLSFPSCWTPDKIADVLGPDPRKKEFSRKEGFDIQLLETYVGDGCVRYMTSVIKGSELHNLIDNYKVKIVPREE